MQQRIRLLAKLLTGLTSGFFVLGHIGGIRERVVLPGRAGDVLGLVHLGIAGAYIGIWLRTRKKQRSERELRVLDVACTLMPVGILAGVLWSSPVYLRPELVVLIATSHVLMARTVIVPSTPRRTLALGIAVQLPLVLGTQLYYMSAAAPHLPAPSLYTIVVAAWTTATLVIATLASYTIYGLRERVRAATQLGQYTLEEKKGEGGMGIVYRARHAMLRRPTAVKLLPPEKAGAQNLARFEREVQLTSRLTHPNTVAIYDYGRTPDGIFYYAMEYLDGVNLQELVDLDGPQPPGAVAHILEQIAGALAEAHSNGLIHRDVKPANVILCERGGVPGFAKVVDFGLVKSVDTEQQDPKLSQVGAIMGTPLYLSPEAIASPDQVGPESDLYSLGAVAYFLLTGRDVFEAKSVVEICGHHLHSVPVAPSLRIGHGLPAALEALILACLEKEPARRPAGANKLALDLRGLACYAEWTPELALDWWRRVQRAKQSQAAAPASSPATPSRTLAVDWQARAR